MPIKDETKINLAKEEIIPLNTKPEIIVNNKNDESINSIKSKINLLKNLKGNLDEKHESSIKDDDQFKTFQNKLKNEKDLKDNKNNTNSKSNLKNTNSKSPLKQTNEELNQSGFDQNEDRTCLNSVVK